MELKSGDLVITLPKVERIEAIIGNLKAGMVGVIIKSSPRIHGAQVYAVSVDGHTYYLFEDEIKKMEEPC